MKLERIDYDEKRSRFRFHMENGETLAVSYSFYLAQNLRPGDELDEALYEQLQQEDARSRARAKALSFATYKRRTRTEIIRRLQRDHLSEASIRESLTFLDELGLINDRQYAIDYCLEKSRLNRWSRRKIEQFLYSKGLSSEDVATGLANLPAEEEAENAEAALSKKYGHLDFSDRKQYDKALRGLLAQGFAPTILRPLLEKKKQADQAEAQARAWAALDEADPSL